MKLTIGVLLLGLRAAVGHETWLQPSTFTAESGQNVQFDLTSGMKFPQLEFAIRPERIAQANARMNQEKLPFNPRKRAEKALEFEGKYSGNGFLVAWVRLQPKDLQLSAPKVREYFAEIDAPADVRETWARIGNRGRWKETYTKCAKTCLRIGDVRDESWREPVGLPLEIVPLRDPTTVHPGELITVQLLEEGAPLSGIALGSMMTGQDRSFQRTDAEGRATVTFSKTGPALIFAVHLRRDQEHEKWQSIFSTFTLEVR